MNRTVACLAFAFLGLFAASNAEDSARIQAHPAIWQVAGKHGSAVLLGSQHIVPANVDWMTPEIEAAFNAADAVVLEAPLDANSINIFQELVEKRGTLPEGQSLRAMLPPDEIPTFEDVLARTGLPEAAVSNKRPWLVAFLFDSIMIRKMMDKAVAGPDVTLMQRAQKEGKTLRYLETAEQQFKLLAPEDPDIEMQYFLETMHSYIEGETELQQLMQAWQTGDVARIDALIKHDFDQRPEFFYKAFFADRNKAMADKIAAMLDEDKTFFIVVGAGHMVGEDGIPALLRAKGFTVTGP